MPTTEEPKDRELTRGDVTEIIARRHTATPEELQFIIDHRKELKLTEGERNQLAVDLTITMSQKARQLNGRREDENAIFIREILKLAETPFGLIQRDWFERRLQAGAEAIARCRNHHPPRCKCWAEERRILYNAQDVCGEKSPEGWAAMKLYEALEELETSSRPERASGAV
ncbi:MAG: hypothetical protein ABSC15_17570 [Terriglobales bacterium]